MKKDLPHQLTKEIKEYVLGRFKKTDHPDLRYHNADHTKRTVENAAFLSDHYHLSEEDNAIVMAAVWFHDIGYLTIPGDHEEESVRVAEKFLLKKGADTRFIGAVTACIRATKIPQTAVNLNQQIVCDADLFGLGEDDFFENDKLLRKESILLNSRETGKTEWRNNTAGFLERHTYYTGYCRQQLDGKKAQNLAELKQKIQDVETGKPDNTADVPAADAPTIRGDGVAKKEGQKERPEKGIETMFRISSGNHQRLSDMADKKAHIMITVNSIIISAVISLVFRKLDSYGFLVAPSFILLSVSLAAMTLSILSTRPSVPHGRFAQHELDEKKS
jgi:predicted metal-dependent HD superfamily phosphohydrolase